MTLDVGFAPRKNDSYKTPSPIVPNFFPKVGCDLPENGGISGNYGKKQSGPVLYANAEKDEFTSEKKSTSINDKISDIASNLPFDADTVEGKQKVIKGELEIIRLKQEQLKEALNNNNAFGVYVLTNEIHGLDRVISKYQGEIKNMEAGADNAPKKFEMVA